MRTSARPHRSSPARRRGRRPGAERGIAILSVITVLVALLIIAIPFVISTKLGRDRTQSNAYLYRARFEAEAVCRAVASYAHRTHPHYEQQRRTAGATGIDADDGCDGRSEFTPGPEYREVIAREFARDGGRPASISDPRGSVWSWRIEDCNGLVNPNGASPYLVGNLIGSARLTADLDPGATTIRVEDVAPTFAPGGPPFRRDGGYLRIGGETIKYRTFEPGEGFQGCERGALKDSAPLLDNGGPQAHKRGDVVVDYVAYKLATRILAASPGTLTPFKNLDEMKTIQAWGGGGVLDADRFEAIAPFMTAWSRRETSETFLDGQTILNPLPDLAKGTGGEVLRFRDKIHVGGSGAYFNASTLVRITDGRQADYGVVAYAGDENGQHRLVQTTLANHLPDGRTYEGDRTVVQALAPYPIDVNTAPREVLAACLTHLHLRTVDDAKLVVTAALAWDLAGRIVASRDGPFVADAGQGDYRKSGPFRRAEDVDRWLADLQKGGTINAKQREAIFRNVLNPHDAELAFGTAPFCYRTLDVYSIEGRAVVNDAGGNKVAESAVRRIVEIGSDAATVWALDSQSDFELGFTQGSGAKFVETYPFNVAYTSDEQAHVQPRLRAPQEIQREIYPSAERSVDVGDVRLQCARVDLPGKPVVKDHMDMSIYQDGWLTDQAGPYVRAVKGTLAKQDANGTWIQPFTISLWMRPYSTGTFYVFDTGKEVDQNRISLFVHEGDQGKELVFRVCDGTLQATGAELYVPLDRLGYKPETWYHLQATARGADPAQMELFVDGVSVGKRRGLTYLASALASDASSIVVDDTQGFEPAGALLIGNEVIEYDESTSTGFNKIYRAMRGTKAAEWPQGMPVRRLGYSHPLLLELRKGGAGLEPRRWVPWGYMQVAFGNTTDITVVDPQRRTYVFRGLLDTQTSDTITLSKITTDGKTKFETLSENDQVDTFSSAGYALMVATVLDTTGGTVPPPPTGMLPAADGARGVLASMPTDGGAPGGAVPGGTGRPSTPAPPPAPVPPPTGGGGGGTGGSGGGAPGGGTGGSFRPPADGSGALPKIGGWEVVWYRRQGSQLQIERYQNTAWHTDAGPYFSCQAVKYPDGSWSSWQMKTWIAPISFVGSAVSGTSFDYLDPGSSGEDRDKLAKYSTDGDPDDSGPDRYNSPRVVVGTTDGVEKEGAVECIRYDSTSRAKLQGSLVFLRDDQQSLDVLQKTLIPYALVWNPNPPASNTPDTPRGPPPTSPGTGTGSGGSGTPPAPGGAVTVGATVASLGAPVGRGAVVALALGDDEPVPGPGGGDGSPTNPTPGGSVPSGTGGRELPPDDSGGGGIDPTPGNGEGGTHLPPAGTRPPADPAPVSDPSSSSSNDPNLTDPFQRKGPIETPPNVVDVATVYPFRGVNDTLGAESTPGLFHANIASSDKDALLLPCFRVLRKDKDTGARVGGGPPGYNDVVTLTTGDAIPRREQRRVRWAHGVPNGRSTSWLALTEFIENEPYKSEDDADVSRFDDRGRTRLLKFPSGELPDEIGDDLVFGRNEVGHGGLVRAYFDELYVYRQPAPVPIGVVANHDTVRVDGQEITVRALPPATTIEGIDGYDKDCGVLAVGGELVVYRGTHSSGSDSVTFERCARGVFGTKAAPHGIDEPVRIVPDLYVSYLSGTLTRDSASIPVGRTRNWPREGLVRIVADDAAELVHFTSRSDTDLLMPESLDADEASRGRGLLRGRFGTEVTTHQNDELVLWQPFRYWDRYMPRRSPDRTSFGGIHDHPESCWCEFAKTVFQAQWRRLSWQENLDGRLSGDETKRRGPRSTQERSAAQKLDILVLARFDQGVPWDADRTRIVDMRGGTAALPTTAREHPERYLYLFDDPDAANRLDVEADTAEFRVYFPYLQGAFVPQDLASDAKDRDSMEFENSWKQTPWLRSFSVEYVNRTKERYSAEVR